MTQLVKLEKRFENAFEKLELALVKENPRNVSISTDEKDKDVEVKSHNIGELLIKIAELEKAAKDDAKEIDRLVKNLKEIIE